MELMLHYVWKHRMFPLKELKTTDGTTIEVVSTGTHNNDAGPDFFDAKIKIGGILWVGNVEIHLLSSDWYRHHHDLDEAYDNVILHVCEVVDSEVKTSKGRVIPQIQLDIPKEVQENYDELMHQDQIPRCGKLLTSMPKLTITSWLSALYVERLEQRTKQIMERRELCDKDWEDTLFVTIARNFGFGKNGNAFEQWAMSIPMRAVGKHRDNLFQIEAIFFGQAGLLEDNTIQTYYQEEAKKDLYYQKLKHEYKYLKQKFSLTGINPVIWKFARLRPQNFPHIRIAQLAMMYYIQKVNLSRILEADKEKLYELLQTYVSDYWKTHYTFASTESTEIEKKLTVSSKDLIIINSVVPILFAYGKYKSDDSLCNKSLELLEQIKPEHNSIIHNWEEAGIDCYSAADSQALIQLTTRYCQAKDCLKCRFGYEYIRHNPGFLKER